MAAFQSPIQLTDPLLWIFVASTILTIPFYVKRSLATRRIQGLEDRFPEVLRSISESLKSGIALETALTEITVERKDLLGRMLRTVLDQVRAGKSFEEGLSAFAAQTRSNVIDRIVSIINLALTAGSGLTTVLDRITEELWSAYTLRVDRRNKTRGTSQFILWGGSAGTPVLLGVMVANFFAGPIKVDITQFVFALKIFVLVISGASTVMHGLVSANQRESLMMIPLFALISYLSLSVSLIAHL